MSVLAGVSRLRVFLRRRAWVRLTVVTRYRLARRAGKRRAVRLLGNDLRMPALPAGMGHAAYAGQLRAARLRVRLHTGDGADRVVPARVDSRARGLCLRPDTRGLREPLGIARA